MSGIIKLSRGGIGNNTCDVCGEHHIPQNKCRSEALVRRISLLKEANQVIPSLLQANKDAVDTAKAFQDILKETDAVMEKLKEICHREEYGQLGPKIWGAFMFETTPINQGEGPCQDSETLSQSTDQSKRDTGK